MNCLKILAKDDPEYGLKNEGFIKTVKHFNDFVEHWNKVAGELKK